MAFNGTRERVKSATREASNRVKAKLSLLPEKPQCDKCGGLMETSSADDPREGAFYDRYPRGERPTWYCADCETNYRREKDDDVTFSI